MQWSDRLRKVLKNSKIDVKWRLKVSKNTQILFEAFFPCQTALPAGRAVSVVLPQRKVEDEKNAVGLKSRNPSDHGVFPHKTIRKAYTAQLLQAAQKGAELAGLAKSKG